MATDYEVANRGFVAFFLGGDEYGVPIERVVEIDRLSPITRLPRVAAYVEGVINLRGQLLPIVDLRTRLGMPRAEPTRKTRIVVAEAGEQRLGMVVDAVTEVVRVPLDQIEATPQVLSGGAGDCIRSVAKLDGRLIALIELSAVVEGAAGRFEGPRGEAANDQV